MNKKTCPYCNQSKDKRYFVDISGKRNPRGKYCEDCLKLIENIRKKRNYKFQLEYEKTIMKKLKMVYGDYWVFYTDSNIFRMTLFTERSFCLYCGKSFKEDQENYEEPVPEKYHTDHMNPLIFGGEDNLRNSVCVCKECNLKKGSKSFVEWLKFLEPEFRELSRQVYIKKHGYKPENFEPDEQLYGRNYGVPYWIDFDDREIKKMMKTGEIPVPPKNSEQDFKLTKSYNPLEE